jgi:hypothetical protein
MYFKVHAAFELGCAGEQSIFPGFFHFLLWAASILLLAVSYFLKLSALADENSTVF